MNKMIPPIRWSTLDDSAAYLTDFTGNKWTSRHLLDAGEKEQIKMHLVRPENTKVWSGTRRVFDGAKYPWNILKIDSHILGELIIHDCVSVEFTNDVNPQSKSTQEIEMRLDPVAVISIKDLRVAASDLEEFARSITCKPAPDIELTILSKPPGKMPRTNIGQLAIKAAWEIECATILRATAKQVITKLQELEPNEPLLTGKITHGVQWVTTKGKEKKFEVEACAKALEIWNKSRA